MADIKAFLLPPVMDETKEVVITKRAVDESGKPIPFVIRVIDQETNDRLLKRATKKTRANGRILSNGCSICAGNVSNAAYRSVSGKPEPGCSKTERSTASAANSSTHKPANRASTTNNPPFVWVGKHIA